MDAQRDGSENYSRCLKCSFVKLSLLTYSILVASMNAYSGRWNTVQSCNCCFYIALGGLHGRSEGRIWDLLAAVWVSGVCPRLRHLYRRPALSGRVQLDFQVTTNHSIAFSFAFRSGSFGRTLFRISQLGRGAIPALTDGYVSSLCRLAGLCGNSAERGLLTNKVYSKTPATAIGEMPWLRRVLFYDICIWFVISQIVIETSIFNKQ